MILYDYKFGEFHDRVNFLQIPVTLFNNDDEGMDQFNRVYNSVLRMAKAEQWKRIVRTKSGGISTSFKNYRPPMYDVKQTGTCVELTVIGEFKAWRFQFRAKEGTESVSGRQAYKKFKEVCEEHNVDLDQYAIEDGEEVKKTIPKPYIKYGDGDITDMTFYGVHHLDLNSSYMSGIAANNPELAPIIEHIYNNRKNAHNKYYKDILTHSYGFFQSQFCYIRGNNYALAELSKQAIEYNNEYIDKLTKKLKKSGRDPILYNTDGIWYLGEVYHDEDEGEGLYKWKNDHVNCKFRAKSKGAYEFIEDGQYFPVIRGRTVLDQCKPRSEWQWGDIYGEEAQQVTIYKFYEGVGILKEIRYAI